MTEELAKQMTWHKYGVRYNPDAMVHPSDGEAWQHFDRIHHDEAERIDGPRGGGELGLFQFLKHN